MDQQNMAGEEEDMNDMMMTKVLNGKLNMKSTNSDNVKDLIVFGQEFIDDADENDKK